MRQGQQNRRGRGRNNNRKGHNPLSRSFESTGPEVKIRGTPAHIAEKYMSLARDAASSGDPVLAENYLQHAEHYNRIIMAFREQNGQASGDQMNGGMRPRPAGLHDPMDAGDEYNEDDADEMAGDGQPSHAGSGMSEQQPRAYEPHGQRFDRPQQRANNHHDHHRQQRGDRSERHERGGDRYQERSAGYEQQPRPYREDRFAQPVAQGQSEPHLENGHAPPQSQPRAEGGQPRRRERERFSQAPQHEQPEFLRRPVRRPRREASPESTAPALDEPSQD